MAAANSATAALVLRQCKFLTLAFSGAGHLLPYHLGVATAIRTNERLQSATKPIHAVSGSSSGAIAATIFVYFSNKQINEYTDRFISDGGRAMFHLKNMINGIRASKEDHEEYLNTTSLQVATTRCSDGLLHVFDFPSKLNALVSSDKDHHLIKCIEASCKIPPHFHPFDVLPSRWGPSTYSEEEGVSIDGRSYVDGGISAPAPPTNLDSLDGACRLIISPISGGSDNNMGNNTIRISPMDDSWKFPLDVKCRGGFAVHPSVQNIKAMQISAGLASPAILREWYERGLEDCLRILSP